jgi:hypothetical protein
MAGVLLERVVHDLESSFIPKSKNDRKSEEDKALAKAFFGEDNEIDGRSSDSLRFSANAHLAFNAEEKEIIRATIAYFVKESETDDTFLLYRSDTPEFQPLPEEGKGGLILCEGLNSIDFTYYDNKGDAYKSWNSENDSFKHRLPTRVSILLEFKNSSDSESPFRFTTAVALPLAMEEYGNKSYQE